VTNPAAFVDPVDDAELDWVVLEWLDSDAEDEVEEVLELVFELVLVMVLVLCVTLATVLVAPFAAVVVAVACEETVTSASFVTVITA
jgi:hypothetical protein